MVIEAKEHLQKKEIMEQLRNQGFRITRQRKLLIDIILGETCSCCKEVYVLASKRDPGIGMATVYRTVDALERVGALKQRPSYQLCSQKNTRIEGCLVELEDHYTVNLEYLSMIKLLEQGMRNCGLSGGKKIESITLIQADENRLT